MWCDSEPGVDTVRIYAENHGVNREFFIWIRFDNMKRGEKGSLPQMLEDLLISETCPLEESASHQSAKQFKTTQDEILVNKRNEPGHKGLHLFMRDRNL